MSSYFDYHTDEFNPYQIFTIYPTELNLFGSHTFHELMITDKRRMNAYKNAIIQAGKDHGQAVWVDIGAGLCPLTLLVAKLANPKKIYAIEQIPSIANLAKKVISAEAATIQSKICLLQSSSFSAKLPKKANILVTETLGNFGIEEGMLALLNDAKKRFLTKNAIIIPAEIEFIIAPIESARCYQRINFWKRHHCGLNFSAMASHAATSVYHHRVLPSELLSPPQKMGSLMLIQPDLIQEKISLYSEHQLTRAGTLHGFVGWFKARLYGNTFLSNDPLKKHTPFNWTQAFFPLPALDKKRLKVKQHQSIAFSIEWNLKMNQLEWDYERLK